MKNILFLFLLVPLLMTCCKKESKSLAVLTTADATDITANSVQTGGLISSNGGSTIIASGVCWSIQHGPTVGDSIVANNAGGNSYVSTITNLNANAAIFVRAFATNADGTSYGNEISFTTAQGVPTVITSPMGTVDPSTGSVLGSGNVINDGGQPVTTRGLCWAVSPHPTVSNFKTVDGSGKGTFSDTLKLLVSNTTYYVRAYATSSLGTAYGNEVSFTTNTTGSLVDIDGNVYPTVTIGTQTWMAANLQATHYSNGDPLNIIADPTSASSYQLYITDTTGEVYYPNNDSSNVKQYGYYYDLAAVLDPRGICPGGWHVPSDGDWETLEYFEGMPASDTGVYTPQPPPPYPQNPFYYRGDVGPKFMAGGSSGLNVQLAGYLITSSPTYIKFNYFNNSAFLWTSTFVPEPWGIPLAISKNINYTAFFRLIGPAWDYFNMGYTPGAVGKGFWGQVSMSIRCIKN